MLAELTWDQFAGWLAAYNCDPWGEWREDLRAAIIASTVHNMAGKIADKSLPPKDFMAWRSEGSDEARSDDQTPEEMVAAMMAIAGASGGTLRLGDSPGDSPAVGTTEEVVAGQSQNEPDGEPQAQRDKTEKSVE